MSKNIRRKNNKFVVKKIIFVFLGLFFSFITIELTLRSGGFVLLYLQEQRNKVILQGKDTYRVLCLGESTTFDQYPSFLQEILDESNVGKEFSVVDKGVPGMKTAAILNKLEYNINKYNPDMVITMMGINDCFGEDVLCETYLEKKSFFESFRIYKLFQFIRLHIVNKFGDFYDFSGVAQYSKEKNKTMAVDKQYLESKVIAAKKVMKSNLQNDRTYLELGKFYRDQGKFKKAAFLFKKAAEVNFQNEWAYFELGSLYRGQVGIDLLKKAIKINPQNNQAYFELGSIYRERGKFTEAENLLKKVEKNIIFASDEKEFIKNSPKYDKIYSHLEGLYLEMKKPELAKKYDKKSNNLGVNHYHPTTIRNYRKLKEILDKKGITYVCMQYPIRSIEPLMQIFKGNKENIIFIDNEKVFKDAVERQGYAQYFIDSFAGNFGHCTDKGNKLLAENIAQAILKEVFGK